MKKYVNVIIFFCLINLNFIKAEEGMWLLPLLEKLNIDKMQKSGCKLSADEIYNVNKSSLKDAVVMFGRWCTGVVISDKGLLLTNHHCGYNQIQDHSTIENNILENGFWAKSFDEEIPNPGLTVSFMVRMEDVTDKILPYIERETDIIKRNYIKDSISKIIIDTAVRNTHYEGVVESYFAGNQYFLIIYETFKDIRLVATPPASIGKFGDETDNWMWPRHTGDFCFFRIYADSSGKPANYSPNNIPYRPKHYLPISIRGINEGTYTMIIGFPGRTMRYSLSFEIEELRDIINPALMSIRGEKLKIMKEAMQKSEDVKLKLSAKYANSSNYWKYAIGQNQGIRKYKIIENLKDREKSILNKIKNDSTEVMEFKNLYNNYKNVFDKRLILRKNYVYLLECLIRGSDVLNFIIDNLAYLNKLENNLMLDTYLDELKRNSNKFYKDYIPEVDKDVTRNLLMIYHNKTDLNYHLINYKKKSYHLEKIFDRAYNKSIFTNNEKFNEFLKNPKKYKINNDPLYSLAKEINNLRYQLIDSIKYYNDILNEYQRQYIKFLKKVYPDSVFYPDANFTMRLTYGKVSPYSPSDALYYNYYTSVNGILEKEDPDNYEFYVPEKLKTLIINKDFGRYSSKDDIMPVCFISENDITGGNSGSPIIDGEGNLIGLAFDSNWESLTGEIIYDKNIKRSICVDSRYILFIVDKFANAHNILNEIKIIE